MSLFTRIHQQFAGALHRSSGETSVGRLSEPVLTDWIHRLKGHQRQEAKALARDLQAVLGQTRGRLNLEAHSPRLMGTVPMAVLQKLQPILDHLTLPPGCELSTVQRWLDHLNVAELTAHGVHPAGVLRERELPARLTVMHTDAGLLSPTDAAITRRVVDTTAREATCGLHGPRAASRASSTSHAGTAGQWHEARRITHQCVEANTPPFAWDPGSRAMERDEASHLYGLLSALPTELLPTRGRAAIGLACEWLGQGGWSELSLMQTRQLASAMNHAVQAFLRPSGDDHRVASQTELAWLGQQRSWVDAGATSRERGIREAGFERDLAQRYLTSLTASPPTPTSRSTSPWTWATAAVTNRKPHTQEVLRLRGGDAGPPPSPSGSDASVNPYDHPTARPAWMMEGVYDTPRNAPQASVYDVPPRRDTLDPDISPYDVPPRRDATGLYDVPRRTVPAAPPLARLLMPNVRTARPAVPVAAPARGPISPQMLTATSLQLKPFLDWLGRPDSALPQRMNVSPIQLASMTQLVRQAAARPNMPPMMRNSLLACSPLLDRVEAGRVHQLSRGDAALLASAHRALNHLPELRKAPPLPEPRRTLRAAGR